MRELGQKKLLPSVVLSGVGGTLVWTATPPDDSVDRAWAFFGAFLLVASLVYFVAAWRRNRALSTRPEEAAVRAMLPRMLYEVLLGVAAMDGEPVERHRRAVADVLSRWWPGAVAPQDLERWSSTVEPARDPVALVQRLAIVLTEHERAALLESGRAVASPAAGNCDDVLRRIRGVLQPPDRAAG